jgi:hypothetical protein
MAITTNQFIVLAFAAWLALLLVSRSYLRAAEAVTRHIDQHYPHEWRRVPRGFWRPRLISPLWRAARLDRVLTGAAPVENANVDFGKLLGTLRWIALLWLAVFILCILVTAQIPVSVLPDWIHVPQSGDGPRSVRFRL